MLEVKRLLISDKLIIVNFVQDLKETKIIITDLSFEKQLFVNSFS